MRIIAALLKALLWAGSAVAGWKLWWPWLFVPATLAGLFVVQRRRSIYARKLREGFPATYTTAMKQNDITFSVFTAFQHLIIFTLAAAIHAVALQLRC